MLVNFLNNKTINYNYSEECDNKIMDILICGLVSKLYSRNKPQQDLQITIIKI
jgi:hypothetical protein